ncbi:MAG: tetratricopeptide repeat protein, partial [Bacteroidota bacterium]|nr:tetratricopeptide repeat protein [Bacteroidota bacterium]
MGIDFLAIFFRRAGETRAALYFDQEAKACFPQHLPTAKSGSSRLPLLLLLIATVFFSITGSAQVDNRLDANYVIQQGDVALRMGNSEKAYEHYTNAIQMDPAFAEAYMKRASLLMRTGRYNEALQDLDQAYHYNPQSGYVLDQRSKVRLLMSDHKGAELDVVAAQELAPYDELLRRERIDRWLDLGRPDRALSDLDSLLVKHPNDTMLHLKKGFIHLQAESLDSALATAEKVLSLNDRSALAHDLRGLALM